MLEQGWSCKGAAGRWAERSQLGASESRAGCGVLSVPAGGLSGAGPGARASSPHRPPEGRGRARVLGPPPRPRDRRGQGPGGTRGPGRADPQAAGRTDRRRGSPADPELAGYYHCLLTWLQEAGMLSSLLSADPLIQPSGGALLTPTFLPGESRGQRSLAGYRP